MSGTGDEERPPFRGQAEASALPMPAQQYRTHNIAAMTSSKHKRKEARRLPGPRKVMLEAKKKKCLRHRYLRQLKTAEREARQ